MTIILLALAALVLWGVIATVISMSNDGYGRAEISGRNRGPEQLIR